MKSGTFLVDIVALGRSLEALFMIRYLRLRLSVDLVVNRFFSLSRIMESAHFLLDRLAVAMSLEAQGVPSKQAEAITSAITEVLSDSLENGAPSFIISKAMIQKAG